MKEEKFQYLCDDYAIYDENGTLLFKLAGTKPAKDFIWSDRCCIYIEENTIKCQVYETKNVLDLKK